jgi:hypothetical protein
MNVILMRGGALARVGRVQDDVFFGRVLLDWWQIYSQRE